MHTEIAYMIGVPFVPLFATFGLRYLFAAFLRDSADWFADIRLPAPIALEIGTQMAVLNCLIYAAAGLSFVVGLTVGLPAYLIVGPAVLGILAAIAFTIRLVRDSLGLDLLTASPIGLVSFAGGGLPLILLFPAILAFYTFA